MRHLVPRQRAAFAIAIAFTVGTIGAAMAAPESLPFGNTSVTLNVSPNDGNNIVSGSTITVTGAGFPPGASGDLTLCTFDQTAGTDFCSNSIGRFTSNASGVFTKDVQVTSTFTAKNDKNENTQFNCQQVACTVQATADAVGGKSAHHLSFTSGTVPTSTSTTSTSTTLPTATSTTSTSTSTTLPTATSTTSTSTSTTLPTATSTTSTSTSTTLATSTSTTSTSTSTTLATSTSTSSTLPGGTTSTTLSTSQCAQLQASRAAFNGQVDQFTAVITAIAPADQRAALLAQLAAVRAQGNASFDQALAQSSCTIPTA